MATSSVQFYNVGLPLNPSFEDVLDIDLAYSDRTTSLYIPELPEEFRYTEVHFTLTNTRDGPWKDYQFVIHDSASNNDFTIYTLCMALVEMMYSKVMDLCTAMTETIL